ncbi:MAG: DinB family protein [Ignavibacteria bacterium]|jgi:uncharacterized damage-inducible protein DinB
MKQIEWFERKFDFSNKQNIFPAIIERLEGTPIRLKEKISKISKMNLRARIDNQWSIQENIGHLTDLEPLWSGRLEDILDKKEEMRPADLTNKKTHQADHNNRDANDLLDEFYNIRISLVNRLKELTEENVFQSALHPRLKTPMRIMDLFLFVAEHDDHHLARITEINRLLNSQ